MISAVEQPDQLRSPSITSPPEQVLLGLVEPVNLTCEAEGHPTPLYEWYRDDELIPGAALPYLYIPAASPEDRGYYTCKAINTQGVAESTPELLTIPGEVSCTHGYRCKEVRGKIVCITLNFVHYENGVRPSYSDRLTIQD